MLRGSPAAVGAGKAVLLPRPQPRRSVKLGAAPGAAAATEKAPFTLPVVFVSTEVRGGGERAECQA